MNEKRSKPLRDRITRAIKGESTPGVDPEVVRELARLLEETESGYLCLIAQWWFSQGCPAVAEWEPASVERIRPTTDPRHGEPRSVRTETVRG